MRLLKLKDGEPVLRDFAGTDLPAYAILSHTWGPEDEEVSFYDIVSGTGRAKRALQGEEKVFGSQHKSTLKTISNLGVLYREQGKLTDAEDMLSRALQGYDEVLDRSTNRHSPQLIISACATSTSAIT
jgi:hypothetical protein